MVKVPTDVIIIKPDYTVIAAHYYNSDKEFIYAFHRGDKETVTFLFNEFYRMLVDYATILTKSEADAEDIVVDSFVKLMKNKTGFQTLADIKAFLYITTRNDFYNRHKHQKVKHRHQKETLFLSQQEAEALAFKDLALIDTEIINAIYEEVEKLPPQCREIFKLRFQQELTISQIAAKLGITEVNVRNQHSKAIKILRVTVFKKDYLPVFLQSVILIIISNSL